MVKILVRKITPRKAPFDFAHFEREIREEIRTGVKPDIVKQLEKTTEGWDTSVSFGTRLTVRRDSIDLFAFATGEGADIYNLVSSGAEEHPITPRTPGGSLTFRTGYVPATRPRVLSSRKKRRFGPTISVRSVMHPGFEAREFYETVADVYRPEYRRRIKNALQRATRRLARANR
jgi:hypothetical protein